MPLLLLCCSFNAQALSATTAEIIKGSEPYFTFDNGVTKLTKAEDLLSITLSDGTHITTDTNTSSEAKPIVLPNAGDTLADVKMLIPSTATSVNMIDLISPPYNYWGDDDGDGQGANGVSVYGTITMGIYDKYGQQVSSRSAALDICNAPYKVALYNNNVRIWTKYGVPDSSINFSPRGTVYFINPNEAPKICYARPNIIQPYGDQEVGPANIWNPKKGFLVQSTESSSYSRNFPTTGANKMYFDLEMGGITASSLTWPTISQGDFTATMTPLPSSLYPSNLYNIRVTLTGPAATKAQQQVSNPSSVTAPTLPQTLEIVGYDSSHTAVLKYGFELKHWFVNHGPRDVYYFHANLWCSSIGYRLPHVKDLTNAKCGLNSSFPCVNGVDGATPSSNIVGYKRNIGAGLFTEWGDTKIYSDAEMNLTPHFWTSDTAYFSSERFYVFSAGGSVNFHSVEQTDYVLCVYP